MQKDSLPTPLLPTDGSEERVLIVDEKNEPLGFIARTLMRKQGLIHRASYVLVRNRAGELFIQKRTNTKDVFPGFWDIAAGGVVQFGESYEESAQRELKEELGIEVSNMSYLFDHYYTSQETRVWGRVFTCTHEGPFFLQAEEIAYGRFIALRDIVQLHEKEPITPDGMEIFDRFMKSLAPQ